jgi:NAD(P)-dependent dehydrogenase (short-subunit alcohol dehydrogenase family)
MSKPRPLRMEGRACLIVGGSSGIGLATAGRFLDEGARVVVCGRSERTLDEARAVLEAAAPGRTHGLPCDAAEHSQVERLFAEALEFLDGRLDVLFHVAGISGRRFGDGPLHECTEEGWEAVLAANARSVFLTNRAAVRRMQEQPPDERGVRGAVLNMGSVLGSSPAPDFFGTYAYAASKGAIRSMTLNAAARYARERIRFNVIEPGLIETPMAGRAVGDPTIRDYLATKQPMAGGPGSADDCAEAALFLCEPSARFLTGVALNVDGGWCVSEGQLPCPAPRATAPDSTTIQDPS